MNQLKFDINQFKHFEEKFVLEKTNLKRVITLGDRVATTQIQLGSNVEGNKQQDLAKRWHLEVLGGNRPGFVENSDIERRKLRVLDLFCGVGGLALGFMDAALSLGLDLEIIGCVDQDDAALGVYSRNLKPRFVFNRNVKNVVDYRIEQNTSGDSKFAYSPEIVDAEMKNLVGKIDIVIGGPPCQGHSTFNNKTRHSDPRNELYLTVPAVAVAVGASAIVIENVERVVKDTNDVVRQAVSVLGRESLSEEGYHVTTELINSERCSVAQSRRRHFLIATKFGSLPLVDYLERTVSADLTTMDAIGDLVETNQSDSFNSIAILSDENQKRIDWLYDTDQMNLDNHMRPVCHQDGHTYPSVYGRMHPDRPAQTLTTGFMSPGRGRYIHPTQRRSLTPHEGARLQGFPDSFVFDKTNGKNMMSKDYSKFIGDAVPPPLSATIALFAIGSILETR